MIIKTYFDEQVKFIEKDLFVDNRGWFIQSYDNSLEQIINNVIIQENVSYSHENTFRGLHYQWDKPMGKLVQCLNGSIIDVVVDIRTSSLSLGKAQYFNLDNPNKFLWIPAGFAHGFLANNNNTIVKYMCNSYYNKECEGAINFMDQDLKILQNSNLNIDKLLISDKDKNAQSFQDYLKHPKF